MLFPSILTVLFIFLFYNDSFQKFEHVKTGLQNTT